MSRPKFNIDGLSDRLPIITVAHIMAKAARSWCYVTPGGRSFYLTEKRRADRMQVLHGGVVYPPEAPYGHE